MLGFILGDPFIFKDRTADEDTDALLTNLT